MSKTQLLESMDSRELTDWWGYFQIRNKQASGDSPAAEVQAPDVGKKIETIFSALSKRG